MLTDAVLLDISQAQRQIDQLETELRRLSQPVRVPVDIDVNQGIDELRRDVQGADSGFGELNSELAETDRELDRIRTSADRTGRELETTGRRGVSSFNGLSVAAVLSEWRSLLRWGCGRLSGLLMMRSVSPLTSKNPYLRRTWSSEHCRRTSRTSPPTPPKL